MSKEGSTFTLNDVYSRLSERVTNYNARLLLHTVKVGSGVNYDQDAPLKQEDAEAICLELIKKGGPAFQVGKDLYNQVH